MTGGDSAANNNTAMDDSDDPIENTTTLPIEHDTNGSFQHESNMNSEHESNGTLQHDDTDNDTNNIPELRIRSDSFDDEPDEADFVDDEDFDEDFIDAFPDISSVDPRLNQCYGTRLLPYVPPEHPGYPDIFSSHPLPDQQENLDLKLGNHILSKLESCFLYSFYKKRGSKRSGKILSRICENVKISKRAFSKAYRRFNSPYHYVDEEEEWKGSAGRKPNFPRTLIISTVLKECDVNGSTLDDQSLGRAIRNKSHELTGKTPSRSTVSRMVRELMAHPDVIKLHNPLYKKPTRFVAEHSRRSSISYLLTVLSTHFFEGKPIDNLHVDENNITDENGRISYDLAKKLLKTNEVCHVLPKLLTSTDETTVYITSKRVDDKQHWFMTLCPKDSTDEIDTKVDSSKRSFFTTEAIDDMAFRGFRISFTKTINADGGVAPGFVIVSGLSKDCMPTPDGEDVQIIPLSTLGDGNNDGYLVFVRKTDSVTPNSSDPTDANESGGNLANDTGGEMEIDQNNIQQNEECTGEFDMSTQLQISKLYREKIFRPWIRDIRMNDYDWDGDGEIPYHLRAVSWQDGAGGQLGYLRLESTLAEEEALKITVNKHSAARSAVEQACDVCPIFKRLKALISEMVYMETTVSQCRHVRYVNSQILTLPVRLEGWKRTALVAVLAKFPILVREACTVKHVRAGFTGNGQVCFDIPIPSFKGCLETLRVPYFQAPANVDDIENHGTNLINCFGDIVIKKGYVEEVEFDEHEIELDYDENKKSVYKKATIRTEGQQRAKPLTHPTTRYRREHASYLRENAVYQKAIEQKNREQNILRNGASAEVKILATIRRVTNNPTASLDAMTEVTMGTRGGASFPSNTVMEHFLSVRIPPVTTPSTGRVRFYKKNAKMKRSDMVALCVEHKNAGIWRPRVVVPQVPIKPNPPTGVLVDEDGEVLLVSVENRGEEEDARMSVADSSSDNEDVAVL